MQCFSAYEFVSVGSFSHLPLRPRTHLIDREPDTGRVLGSNNQTDVVLGSETVINGADTAVGVGREVDPGQTSRQRDERSNELHGQSQPTSVSEDTTYTWVLVRVTVVLLSPESTGLDVGETGDIASPLGLESHLDKLGVLLKGVNTGRNSPLTIELTSIMVCTIPRKLSYEGNSPCRPVRV